MFKWLKNILGIIIIVFLLWYLSRHWRELKVLVGLKPIELVLLYFLASLSTVNNSLVNRRLLKALGAKVSFWDIVCLQNATRLLNHVPMKFGTVFRANYLKRRYGLSYTRYITFFMYFTFLMLAMAAVTGLTCLAIAYGFSGRESRILAGFFLVIFVVSLFCLFWPLPIPTGAGRLSSLFRNFLTGRSDVTKDTKVIYKCVLHLLVTFFLAAARLGIIYHSMQQDIHLLGYLVLGALGYTSLIVSFTPGSLGTRELILGAGATAVGIPLEVGIFAAMFDRAVILTLTFVAGGVCTGWLWRRYPADFKKDAQAAAQIEKPD